MKNEKINDIETFFYPQGIVIIGARSSPGFGYGIPMNLKEKGWEDRLFLVNPKGGQINGMHVYEKVADVPGPASLAIIIIPAQGIPELLPPEDMVQANDAVSLAVKIHEVVSDPERMTRMSARNLKEAQKYCDDVLSQKRIEFYQHIKTITAKKIATL